MEPSVEKKRNLSRWGPEICRAANIETRDLNSLHDLTLLIHRWIYMPTYQENQQALQTLVTKVKTSVEEKEIAVGCFLDIEGTFELLASIYIKSEAVVEEIISLGILLTDLIVL